MARLWRVKYFCTYTEGGYSRTVSAWTKRRAKKIARVGCHRGWKFTVEKLRG